MLRAIARLLLVFIFAAAAWLVFSLLVPLNPGGPRLVMLRPGSSALHIAQELQSAGVIRSKYALLLAHYLRGGTLKAGEYLFDRPANALEVRRRLVRGDIYVRTVVVPEGYNLYDVAAVVEQAGLASRQDFIAAAQSDLFLISDLAPQVRSLEGYLFPDTYNFTRTQGVHDLVATMVRRFRKAAREIGLDPPCGGSAAAPMPSPASRTQPGPTCDLHTLVTLASVIEKETAVPEERPLVASVYYNRLQRGMALQADPSVIYAALVAGRYNGTIHQSDLQFDSPYNTYRRPGLPPGPIANPGRASLESAMHPARTEYLYFVADNQGHHRFSRTLEEHARNVAAYRRAVANGR